VTRSWASSHEGDTPLANHRDRAQRSEAGDTLIEILISLTVVGITGLALFLAFGTSISGSGEHRNLTSLDAALRTASTNVTSAIQPANFANCSDPTPLPITLPSSLSGYQATALAQYWNGSSFTGAGAGGCPTSPAGVQNQNPPQLLTITVASPNGATASTTTVVDDTAAPLPSSNCDAPDHLAFLQYPGNGTAGSALFPDPIVAVEDSMGHTVTCDASTVTLTITAGTGGPGASGASLSNCSAAQYYGETIYTNCSIFTPGTLYTLTASDPNDGLSPIGTTITSPPPGFSISAGAPAKLVFTTSPSNSTGGTAFAPHQPVVTIEDATGNPVAGDTSMVTLAIGNNPGNGTLSGCTGTSNGNGVVSFTGCAIDKIGTGYTLTATDATDNLTLPSGPSSPFNVTPGPATQLAFTTTPPNGSSAGSVFATQPVVTLEDAGGNTATSNTSTITLAIGTNPGGGTLSSGCSGTTVAGVANFSGCSISLPGNGYTLVATDTSLPGASATSQPFNLVAQTLTSFVVVPPTNATAGAQFSVTIFAQDQNGNTITGFTGNQAITFSGPSRSPSGNAPSYTNPVTVNFSGGVGTTTITLYDAQSTTLTATQGSVTGSASLTVGAGAAKTIVATSGSGQSAARGTSFTNKLVATVTDQWGNLVSGASVTFSGPSTGASETFAAGGGCTSRPQNYQCVVSTVANGTATSAVFKANNTAGTYSISANVPGTNTVQFTNEKNT
jgi:type II secretory pathway pseudopilin PulG